MTKNLQIPLLASIACLALGVAAACTTASLAEKKSTETASKEATSAQDKSTDAFAWLEDVEGERALEWVKEQNGRTLS